jgi:hypothetical protein
VQADEGATGSGMSERSHVESFFLRESTSGWTDVPILLLSYFKTDGVRSLGFRLLLVISNNIYLLLLDTITVREEIKHMSICNGESWINSSS